MPDSDAILERLFTLHPKKIDLSLGRTERLLADLGDPHANLPPIIHVAGTNGKGSVIAFLRAILEAAGKRVHTYTSPHLVSFHERIRLAGENGSANVGEATLVEALEECERKNAGQTITHFEITTAAAFWLFAKYPADYLLLEVGLGGRYDATNVLDKPLASVITPISMDHMQFLGETVEEIAHQKSGILKSGVQGIIGKQDDAARTVIERDGADVGAPLVFADQDWQAHEEAGRLVYQDFHDDVKHGSLQGGLLDLPLPRLQGRYQIDNAALAVATIRFGLKEDISLEAISQGIADAEWPARLQPFNREALLKAAPQGSEIWLDGSHNIAGADVLSHALSDMEDRASRPLYLVIGMMDGKDAEGYLARFSGLAQSVVAIPIPGEENAMPTSTIAEAARTHAMAATEADSAIAALETIPKQEPARILIGGSLYLAGHLLKTVTT